MELQKNLLIALIAIMSISCSRPAESHENLTVKGQQLGLWTSTTELQQIPMSGPAWEKVLAAADLANGHDAFISDQDHHNNVQILAAGIVYARTGDQKYKDKVLSACEKLLADGFLPAIPDTDRDDYNRTLAWGRKAGAYVMAADLVGYRSSDFEQWCKNLAEVWQDSENSWTLLYTFKHRPNNWGTHAFSTLVVIYAYLQDTVKLEEIYKARIGGLTGINPPADLSYGDLCWQADRSKPVMINPVNATIDGINVDGIAPDDMRRGACVSETPAHTGYAWEFLHGELVGARVLDRMGYPIYTAADKAYKRAISALMDRLYQLDTYWEAHGDDEAQIPFWDEALGTNYSERYDPESSGLYGSGKSFGWGYVTLNNQMMK